MKVFIDSIGCRLNQSEIEKYANQFCAAGHQLVSSIEDAELVVINTCAVTTAAASDSRQKLRKAILKNNIRVVGTGCLTTLDPGLFSDEINFQVVSNAQKDDLVKIILGDLDEDLHLIRTPIPGNRKRTRAFIKVQDGCDNYCTYCVTRVARGPARSVAIKSVLDEIRIALEGGVKEVVLAGVNLGAWGSDLQQNLHLTDLLRKILTIQKDFRLRLSSIEPWNISPDFFDPWLNDERLCRHFHLPLQSGSARVLRQMARNTTPQKFESLVSDIRSLMPDATITTDVIVGFPGETVEDHADSLDLIKKISFDGGHVFTYSPREGTVAARYPNQVDPVERKLRAKQVRSLIDQSGKLRRSTYVDKVLPVLWEGMRKAGENKWSVAGLTPNNLRVRTVVDFNISNHIMQTKLVSVTDDGFLGEIIGQ